MNLDLDLTQTFYPQNRLGLSGNFQGLEHDWDSEVDGSGLI